MLVGVMCDYWGWNLCNCLMKLTHVSSRVTNPVSLTLVLEVPHQIVRIWWLKYHIPLTWKYLKFSHLGMIPNDVTICFNDVPMKSQLELIDPENMLLKWSPPWPTHQQRGVKQHPQETLATYRGHWKWCMPPRSCNLHGKIIINHGIWGQWPDVFRQKTMW